MTYKIIVDADACPVKAEIRNAASRFDVQVVMVASFDHRLQPEDGVEIVQVDRSDQSVDLYIVNRIQAGDVLVTQDFGLALLRSGRRRSPYPTGGSCSTIVRWIFLLERRHEQAKLRRGGKHTKGPRAFTNQDRDEFLQSLTKLLSRLQENRLK